MTGSLHTAGPWRKVAHALWRKDGRPAFNVMEPGSVGRHHYEQWARNVLGALASDGYTVIKRAKATPASKGGA